MHFAGGKTVVAYAAASHFNSCNTTKINIWLGILLATSASAGREQA